MCTRVVFPLPDRPTKAHVDPAGMCRSTPFSTWRASPWQWRRRRQRPQHERQEQEQRQEKGCEQKIRIREIEDDEIQRPQGAAMSKIPEARSKGHGHVGTSQSRLLKQVATAKRKKTGVGTQRAAVHVDLASQPPPRRILLEVDTTSTPQRSVCPRAAGVSPLRRRMSREKCIERGGGIAGCTVDKVSVL